jgi:hypothetical protein
MDRCADKLQRDGYGLWAVEERTSGEFIGFVGLAVPTWDAWFTPCTEIGWRLGKSAWGHGYATEAANTVLATAFGPLGLDEVVSFTATENLRSQQVMQRVGMMRPFRGVRPPSHLRQSAAPSGALQAQPSRLGTAIADTIIPINRDAESLTGEGVLLRHSHWDQGSGPRIAR